MTKKLLILVSALCLSFGVKAQTCYYQSFTGKSIPLGWGAPTDYTLTANDKLFVTMNDSVGPQQLAPGSPAGNYPNFYYLFATPVNMAVGCKCITFDIDNTGNPAITLFVQAQDNTQNVGSITNKYTDATFACIAAGYVGSVTINYANNFINNYAGGGKIDSTNIGGIQFQPVGMTLGASPWFNKFKGNFTIDNVVVSGTPGETPEINIKKGSTTIVNGGSSTLANVVSGSTGTPVFFTIANTNGTADLIINSITSSGTNASEFTVGTFPTSIGAGTSDSFSVTFAPTSIGTGKAVTLTLAINNSTDTYVINLTANGTAAPAINVTKGSSTGTTVASDATITMTSVASGSIGTPQMFTIENTGSADLTITALVQISGSSEFPVTPPTLPVVVTAGSSTTFTVTFSPTSVATGKTALIGIESNDPNTPDYHINFTADGTVATGINAATANISSTKLYPNPVSDQATIELTLIEPSDVKVTLSDMMGKEVMTIANGSMSSLNESFSVSNLNKGVYTVSYFINGSAAKAQLLMVK